MDSAKQNQSLILYTSEIPKANRVT